MSKQIWSPELIIAEIRRLHAAGSDITQSRMEAIDGKLTSAAIRYFGSWGAAVEAAGIDYSQVAALGRQRRAQKVTKWTQERILEEIRRLYEAGEDLSSAVVRRKYLPLYATARRKVYFGSWAKAVTAAGVDYSLVKHGARERRRESADWKRRLLEDWRQGAQQSPPEVSSESKPSSADAGSSAWLKELLKEKLAELYEKQGGEDATAVRERIRQLIDRSTA
ncbi:MAG: homing endonuclease associated repeat-containing protein [Armatimonadota bacterium]